MRPAVIVGLVAVAVAAAAVLSARVERARWRRALDLHRDLCEPELQRVEAERDQAQRHVRDLLAQVQEALRIIAELSDKRVADAARSDQPDADDPFRGQWVAPDPRAWATFQEGPEHRERN